MINKLLVKERFKKNLKTYKKNSFIQNNMAAKLIEMIPFSPNDILELGCGSGVLTEKLSSVFNYKTYNAIDIVADCENYIKLISENINFIRSDIETYEFKEKYDLIISNATFQWIETLPDFIEKLKAQLKPNGTLIFSTFGKDNFKEIRNITGEGLNYYSLNELKSLLNPDTIEENTVSIKFKTAVEVLKHLKLTGVNSLSSKHWTKSDLADFINKYNKICKNDICLTYNPIYIKINK